MKIEPLGKTIYLTTTRLSIDYPQSNNWALHIKHWLQQVPALYCDSQSALHIASNLVLYQRTNHLVIDCHVLGRRKKNSKQGL